MEKRIKKLLNISFIGLIFMPIILMIFDGSIRSSISNYAYSDFNFIFVSFLTFAGSMLIVDGCKDDLITRNKWYSIILGLSLVGVSVTPHKDYAFVHYTFAGIFFIGSYIAMILFSSPKQRPTKMFLGLAILLSLTGHFLFNWYSLFYAEWIGIIPIVINFTGENNNRFD